MNHITALIAASIISAMQLACRAENEDASRWLQLRSGIREMRECMAKDGAYAFVTNAATPKTAPHIHSQCWVDWLPEGEVKRREYEQEKRDLGLDIIGYLEEYAWDVEPQDDLGTNQKNAVELLTIAEWLRTSHGYGNYMLKRWAENLALIRLCNLSIDKRVGIDEIKSLFNRVDEPIQNLKLRLAILNEESPHKYSLPSFFLTEDSGSTSLCRQWGKHAMESMNHYCKWCHEHSRIFSGLTFNDVAWDNPEYAFYIEDPRDGWHTLRDIWGKKYHYTLCTGAMDMRLWRYLQEIISYKEVVGEIPLPDKSELERPGSFAFASNELDNYNMIIDAKWKSASKKIAPQGIARRVIYILKGSLVDFMTENCRHNHRNEHLPHKEKDCSKRGDGTDDSRK